MKKRTISLALVGITVSTSILFTGETFAKTPETTVPRNQTLMLKSQNGYHVSIKGDKIYLYRNGSFKSYFTYTNRENIVGYGYVTRGNQVLAAQAMLSYCSRMGIGRDINTDGILGPATVNQIKAVQRDYGIKADGIIGPNTWRALIKYWNSKY